MVQEKYSLLSLDEDVDEDRATDTKYAPLGNMLTAADVITCLLVAQAKNIKATPMLAPADQDDPSPSKVCAIMGGFSMQLRGGRQSTRDIDVLTSINMKGVWEAITGDERLVIPDSRLIEGVVKIFVKTGKPFDACAEQHRIEVDVKQAGFRGSPRNLRENLDTIGPFPLFGRSLHFNVLNVAYMMRIKVTCCLTREEPRDFFDVKFMITSYTSQVQTALDSSVVNTDEVLEVLCHDKMGGEKVRQDLALRLHLDLESLRDNESDKEAIDA